MNRPAADKIAKANARNKSWIYRSLVVAAALVIGGAVLVQANTPQEKMAAPSVRYTWTAPTTGSAVDFYKAEVLVNDRDILFYEPLNEEAVNITVDYGNKYLVRVAAVDVEGNQGPWSTWSVAYAPELDPPVFNP